MLAVSQSSGWQAGQISAGCSSLGWCGWHSPNYADSYPVITVMDGHIYNSEEQRPGANSSELLASLYDKHGMEAALQRINGDFAVALYDTRTDVLWLARDRFGVKPLYYIETPGIFAFASRPRALLTLPGVTSKVNREFVALFAASHYRYFANTLERSPYADIAQVPPAHVLCWKRGQLTKKVFWSLQELPDFEDEETELAERYRSLLMDAVSIRLKSAERPAFTLSGGLDSSSVLASAVKVSGKKQPAISTTYLEKTYDESDEIQSSVVSEVSRWYSVKVDNPDVFELVEGMIQANDGPVATATWLSHYLLCEEAAKAGFGSLFGGLGGDELNAGEFEHFLFFFADLQQAAQEERLKREILGWIKHHDHPVFKKTTDLVEWSFGHLVDLSDPGKCLPDYRRLRRYASVLEPDYYDLEKFEPVMDHPFSSYLKNRTYQDLTRETLLPCLQAEDCQTKAFGLDNLLPFLDYRLTEFMFRVPGQLKYCDGVTKHLLRQAMRGVLPEETRNRVKKTGWNAPAHVWFSGKGREPLLDLVHSRAFCERGIYKVQEVLRLLDEHERIISSGLPEENHMMFLWQLVNLELWLSQLDSWR